MAISQSAPTALRLLNSENNAQQFRQPDLRIAARCCGRLRPTLVIAVNMMQASALTSGTWAAGKSASVASARVWAAGCSQFGGRGLCARFAGARAGAFADTLLAMPSRLVHARVQHLAQPDDFRAARSSRRLAPRWAK